MKKETILRKARGLQWLLGAGMLTLMGCSTDVSLNAPYEETTIVYGLMNQAEDLHFVRITKSFLGEESAFNYVTVADSSEYNSVEARIEEWVGNSQTRCWTLRDTLIENKEEGLFYSEGAKAYYFDPSDASFLSSVCPGGSAGPLSEDAVYRLVTNLNEGEKEVLGETSLVSDFSLGPPFSFSPEVNVAGANSSINNTYPSVTINWTSSENSRRYEVALRLNYVEYYSPTDSLEKNLQWKIATIVTEDFSGGEALNASLEGEQFYTFISDNIPVDPQVTKRVARDLDVIFTVAGDDLHTYMEVNEPITGLIQERPAFTNIDGGIGLFSARFIKTVTKRLNKNSLKELCQGQHTGALLFCSDNPGYQLESWYCQ